MDPKSFSQFDNTTPPTTADYVVGYGSVAGVTKNKRWLLSTFKTLWQGVLNITRLDRESSNYLNAAGSASGAGTATLSAGGADTNIVLILTGKGSGAVRIGSTLDTNGNTVLTGGGAVQTSGGAVQTGGGNVETTGGDVSTGAGSVLISGGSLTLSGASSISISGSGGITVASGGLQLTSGNLQMGSGNISVTGNITASGIVASDTYDSASGAGISFADDVSMGDLLLTGSLDTTGNITQIGATLISPDIRTPIITGTDTPINPYDGQLVLFGSVEVPNALYNRGGVYADASFYATGYFRGSFELGMTATPGGGQSVISTITNQFNQFSTVATIGDSATLPFISTSTNYPAYIPVVIRNDGANSMNIFPRSGGTIDGGSVDAAISLASGSQITLYGIDVAGVDTWFTVA